ncbi:methylated-DNA--[protein]-cysteine S-methyltransferase [Ramlibacter rhizophilus]|uniref:Methylated-DNA--protein-cysteine methyltransferase n=1 Tax=Ramlibacter rhizophilus TaxID=1781167 RepID=A0A4Z0BNJ8_9BURK|nr:methylated-DNA--[protein]-cysteine S-methyltransferase [Ramlibacter rhizophilus]TFZ00010.1 methylated-DNA--[protein]-cysteine S-methyltransferase [Ramlibacter rhizophilus]
MSALTLPATPRPSIAACCTCPTPLGPLLLAATAQGLGGAWFEGQKHAPTLTGRWPEDPGHPVLREARAQLAAYFERRLAHFELPLDLQAGTDFQRSVWQALCALPHGATTSYGELARRVARPAAVRAVAAAIGRNPVSIVVPCHRVIGAGGALTGYAGGLDRKTALLRLEGVLH